MIPVGTLCLIIRDEGYPQIVGMHCTVVRLRAEGENFNGPTDCVIDLDPNIVGWPPNSEIGCLFCNLLPIQPDSTITNESRQEVTA